MGGFFSNPRAAPAVVSGGGAFVQIASGNSHTCGILVSGATMCWGRNTDGQLGDGGTTTRLAPVSVAGGQVFVAITGAASGNVSGAHTCALTAQGAAWCWGANWLGMLGDGTTIDRRVPTKVP